jgi:NAD(P)-dependent dehydrogenase (short-subunit alcohol dehydrogenase family)
MCYAAITEGIKVYLANMGRNDDLVMDTSASGAIPAQLIPTDEEFSASLKVLQYLQLPPVTNLDISTPLGHVIVAVQTQLSLGPDVRSVQIQNKTRSPPPRPISGAKEYPKPKKVKRIRVCYTCHFVLTSVHPLYPSLCPPCGNFNTASSALSLPPSLNLASKTALITGARINLGYHTARRLLRCGASVIVTSRYPRDAEALYLNGPDATSWKDRLCIVGADFRTAKDVFALVGALKECLRRWGTEKLDILINNAAQTLKDRVQVEKEDVERETQLGREIARGNLVVDAGYIPRVSGEYGGFIGYEDITLNLVEDRSDVRHGTTAQDDTTTTVIKSVQSSWTQKLPNIPYEDVISAHSINTFVPFILLRELFPIMASTPSPPPSSAPSGYIINISSREGIPESRPIHSSKAGHHVHTNMTKAALNMLTETEASEASRNSRVAINSVDPGYMSADPQWMEMVGREDEKYPLEWEDGAGRVLWAVAGLLFGAGFSNISHMWM